MSIPLLINGTTYDYPQIGDSQFWNSATLWAQAVTVGMLQKAGGIFSLTSEVDFGSTYGLKSVYYKSHTANPSTAGQIRLAHADTVNFRDFANFGDLPLGVNNSNVLTFNGEVIPAGLIVNADIDAAAAIAFSKMAALTASRGLVSDGSGVVSASAATSTEIGYLSGVSSAIQTQITGKLSKSGDTMTGSLTLASDPSTSLQAATKQYVDALATGINAKQSVRVATTTNGTLSTAFANGQTVDGIVLATNDRILIKNQTNQPDNGIYVVQASGSPIRATDANTWAQLVAAFCFVSLGTANAATQWVCNVAAGGTLGSTNVTFVQFGAQINYSATGQGIVLSGNQFSFQINGTTLSQSGSGAQVASGGITNTEVNSAAAITLTKLAAITINRALISNGSGFVSAATTTATEIGFVNGVTSAIQTQLDAKISASVMTADNDMIYRAAGIPSRLPSGSNGYILQSASGIPTWTDPKISYTYFTNAVTDSTLTINTSWTALSVTGPGGSVGTPCTLGSTSFNFAYTGLHKVKVEVSDIEVSGSTFRYFGARLRNTTDSTTDAVSITCGVNTQMPQFISFSMNINVTNIAKVYEIQLAATNTLTATKRTIASETCKIFLVEIERLRQ